MSEFSIDLAAERIIDVRTKDYFREVLSSFINENYRSAIVMLWSVVIADLVYKLQTLRDLYQDPIASAILVSIEAKQKAAPTSSEWEPFLLDELNTRAHLFEPADYLNLSNLQKLRHLSAHPVLASTNLLFAPNKETTRAAIRNALEATLLKPPIYSKKIVTEFVTDIASKKELLPDEASLKKYLQAKYFVGLHTSVEQELIKALWKFCFRLSNADADANREINVGALRIIHGRNPTKFREFVVQEAAYFSEIAPNGSPLTALVYFLSGRPELFAGLTDAAKVPVTIFARASLTLHVRATFINPSIAAHINEIAALPYERLRQLTDDDWKFLVDIGKTAGIVQEVYAIGIKVYCNSGAFDTADSNFTRFVAHHVADYDAERVSQILAGIEGNNQTYWRGRSQFDHPVIALRAATLGIDTSPFTAFVGSLPH